MEIIGDCLTMPDAQHPTPISFHLKEWTVSFLLLLATVQCVRSIFLVNQSALNLSRYAKGEERKPFQLRTAMMPLLRWSESSKKIKIAARFFQQSVDKSGLPYPVEPVTPEKMMSIFVGIISTISATVFCIAYGHRRFGALWWLVPTTMLAILFTTYGARYEVLHWYPYDLPHFALFGIAAVMVMEDQWALAFLLFLIDLPMRETSIYLAPILAAVGYSRGRLRRAALWSAAMLILWAPFYLYIAHRFAQSPSETGVHAINILLAIINPLHWPQVACAFAYLVLPFCFGWSYLSRDNRWFVYGMLPCLMVTALWGVWYETRIWDEWMIPAAVLLTTQASPMMRKALTWNNTTTTR